MKVKRLTTVVTFLLCFLTCMAQDVIIKKDGGRLEVKVAEISDTELKYRKLNNPTGPLYTIKVADLVRVDFENGESEVFVVDNQASQAPATVLSGITGEVKDTELYTKYYNQENCYKIPKRLRRAGLWGGIGLVGIGVAIMAIDNFDINESYTKHGTAICAIGVGGGIACFTIAHIMQKKCSDKIYDLTTIPVFRHNILTTENGGNISVGMDFITNRINTRTMGLGLTYTY